MGQSQAAVLDTIRTWTTVGERVRRVEGLVEASEAGQEQQDPAPMAESPTVVC
jgi:hypothetical protein